MARPKPGTDKWIADGRDIFGRRTQTLHDSKAAAEEHEAKLRLARRNRRFATQDPDVTFEAFARPYFSTIRRDWSEDTRERYATQLENHVYPKLGAVRMTEAASRAFIEKFLDEHKADPVGNVKSKRPLSRASIRLTCDVLSITFNKAVTAGIIAANPIDRALKDEVFGKKREDDAFRVTDEDGKAFTPDQLTVFLEAARESESYPELYVLVMTGMRLGELLGLREGDLDFRGGRIRVRRQMRGKLKTKKSSRDIHVERDVLNILRGVVQKRQAAALELGGKAGPWLFAADFPEAPTKLQVQRLARWIREDMAKACKRAGLPENTPHGLRHTYASQAISMGLPVKFVQQQLGHSSIKLTVDVYGSWLPAEPPPGALKALSERLRGVGRNEMATFAESGTE